MIMTLILAGLEGDSSDQELTDALIRSAARGERITVSGQSFQVVDSLILCGTNKQPPVLV